MTEGYYLFYAGALQLLIAGMPTQNRLQPALIRLRLRYRKQDQCKLKQPAF